MTQDEIVKMAREAGLVRTGDKWVEPARWGVTELVHFAALITAAEREACAKVCDIETALWEENSDGQVSLRSVAAVIRARGQE